MKHILNILVITHNNHEYLAQAVTGIYKFTSIPFKLLVIDNCSTEGETVCYLKELKEKKEIEIFRLPQNLYYFPAVNYGLNKIDRTNKYTLILNDDVVIEGEKWIQYMIDVLESEEKLAYVGDFLPKRFCPPFRGWIDGWCMLFKSQVFDIVGLFDSDYIWWYAPADYAIRTYKAGYSIKDIKRPEDRHNHIDGVIKHLVGKTYEKVKNDPELPIDKMFVPEFNYAKLLRKHGLLWLYIRVEILNSISAVWRKIKWLRGKNPWRNY